MNDLDHEVIVDDLVDVWKSASLRPIMVRNGSAGAISRPIMVENGSEVAGLRPTIVQNGDDVASLRPIMVQNGSAGANPRPIMVQKGSNVATLRPIMVPNRSGGATLRPIMVPDRSEAASLRPIPIRNVGGWCEPLTSCGPERLVNARDSDQSGLEPCKSSVELLCRLEASPAVSRALLRLPLPLNLCAEAATRLAGKTGPTRARKRPGNSDDRKRPWKEHSTPCPNLRRVPTLLSVVYGLLYP